MLVCTEQNIQNSTAGAVKMSNKPKIGHKQSNQAAVVRYITLWNHSTLKQLLIPKCELQLKRDNDFTHSFHRGDYTSALSYNQLFCPDASTGAGSQRRPSATPTNCWDHTEEMALNLSFLLHAFHLKLKGGLGDPMGFSRHLFHSKCSTLDTGIDIPENRHLGSSADPHTHPPA